MSHLPNHHNFRFFHALRVRWAEVDMQKIVFNGHYLMYLDTAVGDYWRTLALPYEEAMARLGGDLYVKKATLEYHASARYDDRLRIGLRCQRIGTSSLQFVAGVFRDDQLLVSGELVYVYADPSTQSSRPVPEALRQALMGYEQGEAMTELRVGPWSELRELASTLRTQVFVDEQNVPAELEWDEEDAGALHAVVINRLGMPVATARLLKSESAGGLSHIGRRGRIGRMAVTRVLRGGGLGRQVLQALMQEARNRGDHEIELHAQCSAEGFYASAGFVSEGAVFEEAGIAHRIMRKRLN
jgi:YbgC/YbaW family acyl-CoA thioester hydrolase